MLAAWLTLRPVYATTETACPNRACLTMACMSPMMLLVALLVSIILGVWLHEFFVPVLRALFAKSQNTQAP